LGKHPDLLIVARDVYKVVAEEHGTVDSDECTHGDRMDYAASSFIEQGNGRLLNAVTVEWHGETLLLHSGQNKNRAPNLGTNHSSSKPNVAQSSTNLGFLPGKSARTLTVMMHCD
jgi:hypothetical protein